LVCISAVLEAAASAIIITANVYCTGLSSLPSLGSIDYCNFLDFKKKGKSL
jgi:hypothetical protein